MECCAFEDSSLTFNKIINFRKPQLSAQAKKSIMITPIQWYTSFIIIYFIKILLTLGQFGKAQDVAIFLNYFMRPMVF